MRYTPADLRAARLRAAGIEPSDSPHLSNATAGTPPPLIVSRMSKGGVGKTSTSVNMAAAAAMMGYRVLFIDADPQASASNLLGIDTNLIEKVDHIGTFLIRKTATPDPELPKAIIHIYDNGLLDLLPADITLTEADAKMVVEMGSHERALLFLKRNSQFLSENYDCIFVDTAPGTTPIGLAFVYASKISPSFITVVEPEGMCLRALESLETNIAEIKNITGTELNTVIVVNKWHPSLRHIKDNMGILYTQYGKSLNDTIIPQFVGFNRQIITDNLAKSRPLVESDPSSIGAAAIIDLTHSIVSTFNIRHPELGKTS